MFASLASLHFFVKLKTPIKFLSIAGILVGITGMVSAQTVNMTLVSVTPWANVQGHAGAANFSVTAGLLNFRVDSVSPTPLLPFPMHLSLFCTELAQSIQLNESNSARRDFTLQSAAQAANIGPVAGLGANISPTGIGSTRARNLEILYGQVFGQNYNPAALSDDGKVAFQLAVWELSHDDDFNLTAIGSNPRFWVTLPTGATVRGQAQTWVSAVANLAPTANPTRMNLSVLHSDVVQDFLIPTAALTAIPEASTYAAILSAIVLGAVLWQRRRRSVT